MNPEKRPMRRWLDVLPLVAGLFAALAVHSAQGDEAAALAALIDREIDTRLKTEGVARVALADDAEFVRRVYLDMHGVVPSGEQAARFLAFGREECYAPGELVTERWTYARTFYVVLDGSVSVSIDGAEVNRLFGRDSFGEIAAIDWGRDFSYGRTATVSANTETRLLAVPGAALQELMLDSPEVDAEIRQIAYDRMHRITA